MMLGSSKLLLTLSCLLCTLFLYSHNHFPFSSAVTPLNATEPIAPESSSKTPQNAPSSTNPTAPADCILKPTNHTDHVAQEKRPRILQATMMFGDKYVGLNERTLQSHVDHAKRWGYGDYLLSREIVGAGQWDKFIFCKILHVLDLIIGESKKPKEERAEWVVWYDADTLILNPNVNWEIFLPPSEFSEIHFIATKNVDGFNAGLFFFRVHEWSIEILSDAYSLRRLRPEIDIEGNIEQNSLKHLFGEEPNKKHIIYQPQEWYNGFKGAPRAETEVNEGDMLVHFAGVNHDGEGQSKMELMQEWFTKTDQHPDKWQVPLEKTKYPKEIEAFWSTYREAKELLDAVRLRPDIESGPTQEVKRAWDELQWAVEELAFDAAQLKKCIKDMASALEATKKPQVALESNGHSEQQVATGSDKQREGFAVGGNSRFSNTGEHVATSSDIASESRPS